TFTPADVADYNTVISTVPVTVAQQPAISGLSLPTGPVSMSFVISGTNFGTQQGTATLDGRPLTILSCSNTAITVQVPPLATTGRVVVTANGVSTTDIENFT